MSLFDYNYYVYPNGDLIIIKSFSRENNHVISESERKKSRNYQLSYQKYRIITSASIELIKSAKNKVIFLTFTFNERLKLDETQTNQIWNKFIKNFKKTYGCENYVGVLEHTKKNAPHYHFLCDFPFVDIKEVDKYWKMAISNYLSYNNIVYDNIIVGSVQLPKDFPSVVKSVDRVVRYICKYFAKSIRARYKSKCYFISRELRERSRSRQLTADQYSIIETNLTAVKSKRFDHCSVFCYNHEELAQVLKCI